MFHTQTEAQDQKPCAIFSPSDPRYNMRYPCSQPEVPENHDFQSMLLKIMGGTPAQAVLGEEDRKYVDKHGLAAIIAFHRAVQPADVVPADLKNSRHRRDIDAREMADVLEVTDEAVTDWEAGKTRITNEELALWRDAIDTIMSRR